MSFKKQQPYQPDMFKVPLLPSRSEKFLYDPKASHNLFYHNVYCKIPEEIFRPLYCEGNGRPGASPRLLCAMRVYKEGGGYSDQDMFEALRFDILVRKSMGLMSLEDKVPTESTYYKFFAAICEYKEKTGIDLYEQACKHVTREQIKEYTISGRRVRMDSTLIGCNIAHYSRYRIVHTTLVKAVKMSGDDVSAVFSASVASQLKFVLGENAGYTCYELNAADMRVRFLELGRLVRQVLAEAKAAGLAGFGLLERVFGEQYRINAETGELEAIPKAKRWLRNNVEAAMFQLTFHTRNNKTRYRGLMKQKIFALSRCLWVNHVRLALFEVRMAN